MRRIRLGCSWSAIVFAGFACTQEWPNMPSGQVASERRSDGSVAPSTQADAAVQRARDASAPRPSPRDASAGAPAAPTDASAPEARDAGPTDASAPEARDAGGASVEAGQPDAGPKQPASCRPEGPPEHDWCAHEGEVCAHWRTDEATGYDAYFACNCIAASSTRLVWNCYESLSGSVQCPHAEPADGSSCDGYRDRTCPYPPRTTCRCPLDVTSLRWECSEAATAAPAPAGWPVTTRVRDLDDTTRRAFCAWYIELSTDPHAPAPPEPPPTSDGYFPSNGCSGCGGGPGFGGMSPWPLPASACIANLALSTCEQPLSELVDCVRSLWSECWPSPRGCARYLEAPGCSGTLVVKTGESVPVDCRIQVR